MTFRHVTCVCCLQDRDALDCRQLMDKQFQLSTWSKKISWWFLVPIAHQCSYLEVDLTNLGINSHFSQVVVKWSLFVLCNLMIGELFRVLGKYTIFLGESMPMLSRLIHQSPHIDLHYSAINVVLYFSTFHLCTWEQDFVGCPCYL